MLLMQAMRSHWSFTTGGAPSAFIGPNNTLTGCAELLIWKPLSARSAGAIGQKPLKASLKAFDLKRGEDLVLNRNLFIEGVLPSSVLRDLTDEEMAHYRAGFSTPDDRQPTLNWPRQIPIEGEPADMVALVESYGEWLAKNNTLPKLFINAEPGSILVGRQREYCRRWPNQAEITVKGNHFIQEDSPVEIGQAVANWLKTLS